MKGPVLLVVLLLFSSSIITAEISPVEYQKMQEQSDEHMLIRIKQVKAPLRLFSRNRSVTILAEVLSVYRSDSNISTGDQIKIRYTSYRVRPTVAGPRPIGVPQKDESYYPILTWSDEEQCYVPSARGYSFEPPISPRW